MALNIKMTTTRYAHIGSFEVVSGTLDIADPYINPLTIAVERIPLINEKMVKVTNMLCGNYDAYHLQECYDGTPIGLLLLHNAYSLQDIVDKKGLFGIGYASSSIGSGIVAVDAAYRYDTRYCYYPIEPEAYYDGELILNRLSEMDYDDTIKQNLKDLVTKVKADAEWIQHPTGQQIINAIGNEQPIWSGFSEFGCQSSQWSIDILNRMNESSTRAAVIKGGVVSTSRIGFSPVYKYLNNRLNVYAVYVSLVDNTMDETKFWNPDELPDFTHDL